MAHKILTVLAGSENDPQILIVLYGSGNCQQNTNCFKPEVKMAHKILTVLAGSENGIQNINCFNRKWKWSTNTNCLAGSGNDP